MKKKKKKRKVKPSGYRTRRVQRCWKTMMNGAQKKNETKRVWREISKRGKGPQHQQQVRKKKGDNEGGIHLTMLFGETHTKVHRRASRQLGDWFRAAVLFFLCGGNHHHNHKKKKRMNERKRKTKENFFHNRAGFLMERKKKNPQGRRFGQRVKHFSLFSLLLAGSIV